MINYYYSPSYLDATLAQMISSLKDGILLLTTQTDTEIYQVVTDTTTEYEVTLNAGNGVYFDIRIASGVLSVSYGKVSEGVYTADGTSGTDSNHPLTHSTSQPFYCELVVINGGDAWEFKIVCVATAWYSPLCVHMRTAILESSLSSDVMRSAYTYNTIGDTNTNSFPDYDKVYMESGYVQLDASGVSSSIGERNTPDGKVMLFPALLGPRVGNSLGVPTIGSKIAYSMLGRGMPISPFTEFVVGGSRFVSLGSVAIRSS